MIYKQQTITEAGVTTPESIPVDTNGRDIKTAKVVKGSHYKTMKTKVNYASGIFAVKNLQPSGLR